MITFKKIFQTGLRSSSYPVLFRKANSAKYFSCQRRNYTIPTFSKSATSLKGTTDNSRKHSRLLLCGLALAGFCLSSEKSKWLFCEARDSSLCRAVKRNDITAIKRLLQSGHNGNEKHKFGWSPLHVAVINGNIEIAKILLEAGADINVGDEFSLKSFSRYDMDSITQILRTRHMEFSSQINPRSETKGCTPLHFAAVLDNLEMVNFLLDKGADPLIQNASGHSAKEYVDVEETKNGEAILKALETAATEFQIQKEAEEKELRIKFPLEQRLKKYIVGQEGPINIVSATIRRKENGWHDEDRPLVFLFLGSSGIGKTELAKRLASYIHKDKPEGFIRIDMSEFQSKHEVSKFIGSPPGYVGYEEGGQLTERLRSCPNAVVLFDEVEKAHPDVLTVMLQLFDEGRLTDGKGKTIDCKDAIFVMTSNLAQNEIATYGLQLREEANKKKEDRLKNLSSQISDSKSDTAAGAKASVTDIGDTSPLLRVTKSFRDQIVQPILIEHLKRNEFLGRINEIVYFLPFSEDELGQLVTMELDKWKEKAKQRNDLTISWTDDVVRDLTLEYNVNYGARSLKFEVDRRIVNKLAELWEQGAIVRGSKIEIYMENDVLRFKCSKEQKRGWFS